MNSFKKPGDVLTLTAPYDVASGAGAKVGAIFGVAAGTYLSGATGEFMVVGVHTLAKTTGQAWLQGDRLYWDDSGKKLSNVATAGQFVGTAPSAADTSAATGDCRLNEAAPEFVQGQQATIAALTFGTNVTAATANGSLEDSAATNPSDTNFNNNMKELGTKVNAIIAALHAAGITA